MGGFMGTTNYNAQDMAIVLDNVQQSVAALHVETADLREVLGNIQSALRGISVMMSKEYELEDLYQPITLTTAGFHLDRKGRRFIVIFTPTAISNVPSQVLGIPYTFNLIAGWNVVNLPDGTLITAPSGTTQAIIVKATNWVQAGAI